jgi:16S rRNA (guanine527-N7)-methyltransferase
LDEQPSEMFHVEHEPASAARIFGLNIDKARAYTAALVADGETLGLLGPREYPRIWTRHVLNSAVVAELVPAGVTVADVGSGAGLPGIPMALVQPEAHFTLIEPMERRSDWLKEQVEKLGLTNITVLRARAEEVGEAFDIVTARAVKALPQLLQMCVPMTKHGGQIIALKGEKAQLEIDDSKRLINKLGIHSFDIVFTGEQFLDEPTRVVRTKLV